MDLSATQQLIKDTARSFLEGSCSLGKVQAWQDSDLGYSQAVWSEMGRLGWLGIAMPEEYGGADGTFLDQLVLCEEFGRAGLPSPYLTTAVDSANLLLRAGSTEQRDQWMPPLVKGELVVAFAFVEPEIAWDPRRIETEAVWHGDELTLKGTKLFVPYANSADRLLCLARQPGGEGLVAAMVNSAAAGIDRRPVRTSVGNLFHEVVLADVAVPRSDVLGDGAVPFDLVEDVLRYGALAQMIQAIGMGRRVLELATDYAKVRVQFGHPIGSYQGIQHKLAEMLSYLDAAQLMVYQAGWLLSERLPAAREVAKAKAFANEVTWRVLLDGHNVFGATGYMREHDMEVYTRQGMAAMLQYGTTEFHRDRLATAMGM